MYGFLEIDVHRLFSKYSNLRPRYLDDISSYLYTFNHIMPQKALQYLKCTGTAAEFILFSLIALFREGVKKIQSGGTDHIQKFMGA